MEERAGNVLHILESGIRVCLWCFMAVGIHDIALLPPSYSPLFLSSSLVVLTQGCPDFFGGGQDVIM